MIDRCLTRHNNYSQMDGRADRWTGGVNPVEIQSISARCDLYMDGLSLSSLLYYFTPILLWWNMKVYYL